MQLRPLGRTGLSVSAVAFGAGPISGLFANDDTGRRRDVIAYALQRGVNWFDTAATYGNGASEIGLGRALEELGVGDAVHVATKVRLQAGDLHDIRGAVRRSVVDSLRRLRRPRVTLLQLHNSITSRRGEEPTSITPDDVLGQAGVLQAFEDLRRDGLVGHFGLTGIGSPASMKQVIASGAFATIQVPYHLLNPTAGCDEPPPDGETDFGNVIDTCAQHGMGVFAIRVLAGGALADNDPSAHTYKTPFFPLDLYHRDRRRAIGLKAALGPERRLTVEAVRFALAHPQISSAIIGFGAVREIDEALAALEPDPAPIDWTKLLSIRPKSEEPHACRISAS